MLSTGRKHVPVLLVYLCTPTGNSGIAIVHRHFIMDQDKNKMQLSSLELTKLGKNKYVKVKMKFQN